MKTDDYTSEQFKSRVTRLVSRLGQVWDNDPRVGIIEMGIQGKWGEQSDPSLTPEMEKVPRRCLFRSVQAQENHDPRAGQNQL